MVTAGFATSRNVNIDSVEYEITPLGRTALVLRAYGLVSTEFSSIEPHRHDVDGLWYVKVSSDGNPAALMGIGAVMKLATQLRAVGAIDLAGTFEREAERARRYALG